MKVAFSVSVWVGFFILTIGLLVGCDGKTNGDPTPTFAAPTPPTRLPPPPTPPAPTAPDGLEFSLEVGDGLFDEISLGETDATNPESLAILILRDRSGSVLELCSQDGDANTQPTTGIFNTAGKEVARFLFTFLERGLPAGATDEIYIGAGAFPAGDYDDEVSDFSLQKVSAYGGYSDDDTTTDKGLDGVNDKWDERVDAVWNAGVVDKPGLYDVLVQATHVLTTTGATNRHIIIIGDGMVKHGDTTDWDKLLDKNNGLANLLVDNNVYLNYVLVDCPPKETRVRVTHSKYVDENLERWADLGSLLYRSISADDATPWPPGVFVRVYGRDEFLTSNLLLNDNEVLQQLLNSVAANYLPVMDNDMWQRGRALLNIGDTSSKVVLPVPGYADSVTFHTLTMDKTLTWASSENHRQRSDSPTDTFYKTYSFDKRNDEQTDCMGQQFGFTRAPDSPVIVWWEIEPVTVEEINGRIIGVTGSSLAQVTAEAISEVKIFIDDQAKYITECFAVGVQWISDNPTIQTISQEMVLGSFKSEFTLPYEALRGFISEPPFIGEWRLILSRKTDVRGPNGTTLLEDWKAVLLNGPDNAGQGILFDFYPRLNETASTASCREDPTGTEICTVTFVVNYATGEYYGGQIEAPNYYLFSRQAKNDNEKCVNKPQIAERLKFFDLAGVEWAFLPLNDSVAGMTLSQEIVAKPPEFTFHVKQDQLEACGYEYLVVLWKNEENSMMVYSFGEEKFIQGPMFTNE